MSCWVSKLKPGVEIQRVREMAHRHNALGDELVAKGLKEAEMLLRDKDIPGVFETLVVIVDRVHELSPTAKKE